MKLSNEEYENLHGPWEHFWYGCKCIIAVVLYLGFITFVWWLVFGHRR